MLTVKNVSCYYGEKEVLSGINFEIPDSSIVGLMGPGAGGKSTLLKIIGMVNLPQEGMVEYTQADSHEVSLMFQEGALFDSLNVFDNVAFPLVRGRVPTYTLPRSVQEEVHVQVDDILARVGLSKASQKVPAQLSGGMKRRVSLARALVVRPKILLLDDPTCGLDPVASSIIMELILELHKEIRPTTILVSHDLRRLLPMVDTVIALFDGRIRFIGTVKELKAIDCPKVKRFVSCRYDLTSPAYG